jgi:hypothetical protein
MKQSHSITLVLSTVNADVINANKTSMTWNNLYLKNIMGNIYDEYDFFDIRLNSVICLSGSATDANNNVVIYLQGLPWIGLGNSGRMPVALNRTGNTKTGSLIHASGHPTNSFFKMNTTCSLTITLDAVSTNTLSTTAFGHSVYLFTITGIK